MVSVAEQDADDTIICDPPHLPPGETERRLHEKRISILTHQLSETRDALGARPEEQCSSAAIRVVRERDALAARVAELEAER